jgi:hypothetical protein
MGAIVVAGASIEPQHEGRYSFALQILLVLGWGTLFVYCAAYLYEDLPFRAASIQAIGEPLIDQSGDLSRSVIIVASPERATPPAVPVGVQSSEPTAAVAQPVASPATPRSASVGLDYVGMWGPTADACSAPSRRNGYVPATITPERAKAGETVCSFRGTHRVGNGWAMAADCGDREHRWSSQVRLAVSGDRLTWTSAMGTSTYVRCGRRAG